MAIAGGTVGQFINQLVPGVFATLQKIEPSGALQVRKQSNGAVSFHWRYTMGTKSERVAIGFYDSSAPPKSTSRTAKGYSIAGAIRAAEALASEHYGAKELGGRPALLEARREEESARAERDAAAARYTLANLLNDYADYLEKLGRTSHREVRSIVKVHVLEPWAVIAKMRAADVTTDQFIDIMRRVMDAKKGRTSNKLRSYLRAAYQTAKSSRTKASVPEFFKHYKIVTNPVADTEPDETQNRADKNPLERDQLRLYWNRIKPLTGLRGAVLRLHLLTGGQRIEQLVKLKTAEIRTEFVRLYDGKGRPGRLPRAHEVPLLPEAAQSLQVCKPRGLYALSTDGGDTHIAGTTLSGWAVEAAGDIEGFQAKRIRSGVETLLSKHGVSQEIRGHLQSHGVSGVQRRHYDANDFIPEKRRALEILWGVLDSDSDPVEQNSKS